MTSSCSTKRQMILTKSLPKRSESKANSIRSRASTRSVRATMRRWMSIKVRSTSRNTHGESHSIARYLSWKHLRQRASSPLTAFRTLPQSTQACSKTAYQNLRTTRPGESASTSWRSRMRRRCRLTQTKST